MRKTLVLFLAFALMGAARSYGQTQMTLPNGNVISHLANGENWATIHIHGEPLAIQLLPGMPATGQFRTAIVRNTPDGSDIVGAPQSLEVQILGNCQSKTFQVLGTLPYEGKMRAGAPEVELGTGPEPVTRRVEPNSPMEHVFAVVCKR